MDSNLRRNIIIENYKNPKNKGLIDDESYYYANTNNESCIDEVKLMVKIENEYVKDIRFDGEACAICTSSCSIMIKTLIGKSITEAIKIYNNLVDMLDGKEYEKDLLEKIIVYDDINKQPNRKTCVLLPWWAFKKIIDEVKGCDKD